MTIMFWFDKLHSFRIGFQIKQEASEKAEDDVVLLHPCNRNTNKQLNV